MAYRLEPSKLANSCTPHLLAVMMDGSKAPLMAVGHTNVRPAVASSQTWIMAVWPCTTPVTELLVTLPVSVIVCSTMPLPPSAKVGVLENVTVVAIPIVGDAQVPSPRKNVELDALVPLFICDVAMFPFRLVNDDCNA